MGSVYKLEGVGTTPSGLQGYRTRCFKHITHLSNTLKVVAGEKRLASVFSARIPWVDLRRRQDDPDTRETDPAALQCAKVLVGELETERGITKAILLNTLAKVQRSICACGLQRNRCEDPWPPDSCSPQASRDREIQTSVCQRFIFIFHLQFQFCIWGGGSRLENWN